MELYNSPYKSKFYYIQLVAISYELMQIPNTFFVCNQLICGYMYNKGIFILYIFLVPHTHTELTG